MGWVCGGASNHIQVQPCIVYWSVRLCKHCTICNEKPFPAHTTMLFSLNKTFIVCVILSLKRANYLCKTSAAATENAITLVRNSKAKSSRVPHKGFIVLRAMETRARLEQWQNSMRGCMLMWVFK